MFTANYTPKFLRDVKRLQKKHFDLDPLRDTINLILEDSKQARRKLKRHYRMYRLNGKWAGSLECHVANIGDWLVVWQENDNLAIFLRTGTHDEIFK